MSALGWLLLALPLVLLLLALVPPVDITIQARLDEQGARQRVSIGWLGMRRELRPSRPARAKSARRRRRIDGLAMLRTEGALAALRRMFGRLSRSIRVRMFHLRARIGLGDPAQTGMAIGAIAPLFVLMPVTSRATVIVEPDYARERVDLALDASARIWPLLVVAAVLAFFCTPAVWRAAHAGRRA